MIKGVGKRIVLLSNTESEVFEQAIFILKSETRVSNHDVVAECERMMNYHVLSKKPNRARRNYWKIGFFILLSAFIMLGVLYSIK